MALTEESDIEKDCHLEDKEQRTIQEQEKEEGKQ